MAVKKPRTRNEMEVIESFQIVLRQISELRMDYEALTVALLERGALTTRDLDLSRAVVRERRQEQADALLMAVKEHRKHDALLRSNPGAKGTKQ